MNKQVEDLNKRLAELNVEQQSLLEEARDRGLDIRFCHGYFCRVAVVYEKCTRPDGWECIDHEHYCPKCAEMEHKRADARRRQAWLMGMPAR